MFRPNDPELRKKLAEHFPTNKQAQRLCALAGIDWTHIHFDVRAPAWEGSLVTWSNILDEALYLDKVSNLCIVAPWAARRHRTFPTGDMPYLEAPDDEEPSSFPWTTQVEHTQERTSPPRPSVFVQALSIYYRTIPDVRRMLGDALEGTEDKGWEGRADRTMQGQIRRSRIISKCNLNSGVKAAWWSALHLLTEAQKLTLYRLMCAQYATAAPVIRSMEAK
jgi:hypothetical protein